MNDNRPPYQPVLGQPTTEELHAKAEQAVTKGRAFGLDVETAFEVLKSGETLAHYAAFKNVATANDFAEARRRLAEWEASERQRKATEQGWPS